MAAHRRLRHHEAMPGEPVRPIRRFRPLGAAVLLLVAVLGSPRAVAQGAGIEAAPPGPVARKLTVERFKVEGPTLLAPEAVAAELAPFRGERTLAELRRAAEAVQRLYAEAGWGGVVAYLPPQDVSDGTVTIVVVEGKVTRITVRGAGDAAGEAAVRAALPALVEGQTPALRRIDRQLQIANENPARQIQLLLAPGDYRGEITAEVALRERPPIQFALTLDDTGNDRTGKWRAGAMFQHADLSGVGDVATLQVQTSPTKTDKVALIGAAYRRPLPAWSMMFDAYAAYSDVDAGASSTPAGSLRITGRGSVLGLRGTGYLPRWGEVDQRLGFGLDRREYLNGCAVENLPQEACGGAGTDVTVAPLTLEYTLRSADRSTWGATFGVSRNFGWGGTNAAPENFAALRPGAGPDYTVGRLAASGRVSPVGDWYASARMNLQWTGDALVSGEQFGIGGASSVRGYEERELVGDRGAMLSLELSSPEWLERATVQSASLRGFAFADGGVVENLLDAPCREQATRCTLGSVGLGVAFEWQGLQMRLTGASALRDGLQTRKGDSRAHFAAQFVF
jgi:hemolysin activation/secretion protein